MHAPHIPHTKPHQTQRVVFRAISYLTARREITLKQRQLGRVHPRRTAAGSALRAVGHLRAERSHSLEAHGGTSPPRPAMERRAAAAAAAVAAAARAAGRPRRRQAGTRGGYRGVRPANRRAFERLSFPTEAAGRTRAPAPPPSSALLGDAAALWVCEETVPAPALLEPHRALHASSAFCSFRVARRAASAACRSTKVASGYETDQTGRAANAEALVGGVAAADDDDAAPRPSRRPSRSLSGGGHGMAVAALPQRGVKPPTHERHQGLKP